jgi:hypothetical protein
MAVKMSILVFCPEDGDSMFLQNVGTYLQVHRALQQRRPTSIITVFSLVLSLMLQALQELPDCVMTVEWHLLKRLS